MDSTFLGVHLDSTSLGVHLDSTSRKSCGPAGGHEQDGTGTAAVDWAKVVEKFWCLSKTSRRRILSYGSSRAAGGGTERSWGAGEVLERSLVKVEAG